MDEASDGEGWAKRAQQINKKMLTLEKRKAELEGILSQAAEPPPSLHPGMASYYRSTKVCWTMTG
jgi:hypothetical protein